jgi:hydroxymethylglutaryl-CoA lyase
MFKASWDFPKRVKVVDVGARDGLQNEAQTVPAEIKIELVNRLAAAGVQTIECASFVSPKWVPAMATSAEVMAGITRKPGVVYAALTPNQQGFDAALAAQVDEVVIFGAASEAFSQKNINCSIAQSIDRFTLVAEQAKARGLRLRAAISCAFGCPYQGEVSLADVMYCVDRFVELGCDDIGIADTIGVGTALHTQRVFAAARERYPTQVFSGHFHDTYGQALSNILASLSVGIDVFDASVAGLGGCPYAKGATGNVATEDVLYLLHNMGIETGIDLDAVCDAGYFISDFLGRASLSRVSKALRAKRV